MMADSPTTNSDHLRALYPFALGRQDSRASQTALLESIVTKARQSRETNAQFFSDQGMALLAAAQAIAGVYRSGGRLLTMGNGGSSCDAAHIAVEFSHPVTTGRPALPAINLTADVAMISAVGNDVGFEHIFVRQVIAHGRRGDALIGASTSGNSRNLLTAFAKARELGIVTVGLSGGDGGKMKSSGLLDHCLVVPSSSIHRIQETHVAAYHILWDLVHTLLAEDRGMKPVSEASNEIR
jgi:D-sedoheptulose 7-phosphate isomerase